MQHCYHMKSVTAASAKHDLVVSCTIIRARSVRHHKVCMAVSQLFDPREERFRPALKIMNCLSKVVLVRSE